MTMRLRATTIWVLAVGVICLTGCGSTKPAASRKTIAIITPSNDNPFFKAAAAPNAIVSFPAITPWMFRFP